jgi:hypothetical protein
MTFPTIVAFKTSPLAAGPPSTRLTYANLESGPFQLYDLDVLRSSWRQRKFTSYPVLLCAVMHSAGEIRSPRC